ncbi:MAG: acyl-CoA dehydrogenase family protein [Deltaproteobacteria bacterium]|nr:acyl-CoA dehydrogenase family protein [Deltaproteobacteria bacterium]
MLSLKLGQSAEKLQLDFAKWLKANPPPAVVRRLDLESFVEISTKWQRQLASERWVAVHWPEEFGGRGLSLVEEALIQQMLAEVNSPQLINLFGITMVGPVLIEHGSQEQKKRFLSKILSAEEIWCQGFSEPQAGSDLASLGTRADRVQDGLRVFWRINGQKVWTSFAQYADWCFMLARTDVNARKHEGLSYFLVPMEASGICVKPLMQISGDDEFNEVFFEDVEVEQENIVGNLGDGWKIAISTLMYERVVLTFARHLQSHAALKDSAEVLRQLPNNDQSLASFGRLLAKNMAIRALAINHLIAYSEGATPGPEGSLDKLIWSETFQEICSFALELLGDWAPITGGADSVRDGIHQYRYLYSRGRTIAAGTSEIQRNIIAERILGLPRTAN